MLNVLCWLNSFSLIDVVKISQWSMSTLCLHLVQNMLFPGVTICSLNMLKKKRIKEFTKGSFETLFGNYSGPSQEMYKERFKERLNNNSFANFLKQNIQVASHAAKRDDMLFRINNKQYSDRLRLGYAFSEFIKSCTWNGIMCDKGYVCIICIDDVI